MRLVVAIVALMTLPTFALANDRPSQAECKKAGEAIPSAAEISKMTAKQKGAARSRLKASEAVLKQCLVYETETFLKKAPQIIDNAKHECDRRGPPKIGMTSAELVETCWRRPSRIVKKTTAAGVQETYIYGIGHRVTLVDGKVSEIVEAQ